jgi:hypothetical protein
MKFACDWRQLSNNLNMTGRQSHAVFAYNWRPLGNNLNATGRQSHGTYFGMRLAATLKSLIAGDEQMLSSSTTESVLKNILYTTQIREFFDESVNWIL